ncbi:MAG: class I SAM-dependent methyltransferase [Spirulinaceae cyanobacterium]
MTKIFAKLFESACYWSPQIRTTLWKSWYQFLAGFYHRKDWRFMNYGYAAVEESTEEVHLDEIDADNRYCIQLYHHVVNDLDLRGFNVLEVGSGRGGGTDYIKRYFKPKTMIGVDFSENAVNFCQENYTVDGLSFKVGNAEFLPFPDDYFDTVVNVESSHCYGSIRTFFAEVKRVLCEGGYFLFTDFRSQEQLEELHRCLSQSGLDLIKETNITPNILRALELDSQRKTSLIEESVNRVLVQPFQEFAGIPGSKIYERFKNGETVYKSFVLQKAG